MKGSIAVISLLIALLLVGAAMVFILRPSIRPIRESDAEFPIFDELGEPTHIFTVRGRVATIPTPGDPTSSFQVHHEAIPDFIGPPPQNTIGMDEMVMGFPPADDALLEGVQPGDKVEITFAVWYESGIDYKMIAIDQLPADTTLNLNE